jgi:hypothetical protein
MVAIHPNIKRFHCPNTVLPGISAHRAPTKRKEIKFGSFLKYIGQGPGSSLVRAAVHQRSNSLSLLVQQNRFLPVAQIKSIVSLNKSQSKNRTIEIHASPLLELISWREKKSKKRREKSKKSKSSIKKHLDLNHYKKSKSKDHYRNSCIQHSNN